MSGDITINKHMGDPLSMEAYESTPASERTRLRTLVFATVLKRGSLGATSDEVEVLLDMPHQSISARFTELEARGSLVATGLKRKTRSGRNAAVWEAV